MADRSAVDLELVEAIFHEVADLPLDARRERVAERCGDDGTLRERVEALLAHDDAAGREFLAGAAPPTGASGLPERVGGYRVVGVIGEGGMGIVYEAEQENPRRSVALKLMRNAYAGRALIARFEREAAALARMRHPGIAQIHEAGSVSDGRGGTTPFFAMELVRGVPLDRFVRERSLPSAKILALVAEIAEIVQYAHDQGVVHRDLKPANILVESGEGEPRPRILDFGIARLIEEDTTGGQGQSRSLGTDVGQLIGTLPYMSPERVEGGSVRIDARADVYALGVILYELLTGRLPLELRDRPIAEAARIIRDEDPSRLSSVDRGFRGDVETIVLTAMEKDPDRRYPSAAALAADIRRHLTFTPILARPTSAFEHLRKFARRHRTLVAATSLVVVASIIAAIVSTNAWLRADRERASAERRYTIATQLSDLIRSDVLNSLEELPGGRELRLSILTKVTPYYEMLASERPGDPARIRTAWQGLTALGRDYELVGQIDEARGTLRQAEVAIRDALTKRDDLDFREDLGWTRFFQGWVEYRGGDRTKAAPIYRDAIAELEPVVLARGKGSEVGEKLAQTYRRLGDLLNETGDAAGARSQYLLALELDEARLAEKPTLAAAQMNVTRTWRRLGQLARQSGERAEAMGWLTRTVELREQLATGLVSASVQHNLAVALEDLGQAQLEAGACAAAAATLRRAVERCDIGLSMDTEDVLIVQESAVCRCRLSAALACAGDASEAAAAGANAVAMIDQALARPSTPTTLRAIAAMALVEVEPPALRDPTRALALIESALAESGGNDLSMWETKANALAMLGRRAEAAEAERRVIDLIAPGDVRRRAAAEARRAEFLAPVP